MLIVLAYPAGLVTRDAFDWLGGVIVETAAAHKQTLSGILLGLHGAMVTGFCEDGKGEVLERLRTVVGSDLPISKAAKQGPLVIADYADNPGGGGILCLDQSATGASRGRGRRCSLRADC